MKSLFIFGDSIGVGQYIPPHITWVHKLSEWITNNYHKNIIVQNASRNGDTTRLALERMPSDIQKYKPDYVVIQFGINDANFWQTDKGLPRISPDAFRANILEIIERLKFFGTEKIILNTNHLQNNHDIFLGTTDISLCISAKRYNNIIKDVGTFYTKNVYLNDIEKYIFNNADYKSVTLDDGIHLNVLGHKLYFNNMVEVIKKVLK